MNIVIFGPPGAGKGTQSSFLINNYNLFQLSTGDLLREELKSGSSLAKEIEGLMNAGNIFDGFPRNLDQAKTLDSLLLKYNQKISVVLNLKVDYSILVKRISGRVSCSVCKKTFNEFFDPPTECEKSECKNRSLTRRSDDNEETVTKRLNTYDEQTLPILGHYNEMNLVKDVDAMQDISNVSEQISNIIRGL